MTEEKTCESWSYFHDMGDPFQKWHFSKLISWEQLGEPEGWIKRFHGLHLASEPYSWGHSIWGPGYAMTQCCHVTQCLCTCTCTHIHVRMHTYACMHAHTALAPEMALFGAVQEPGRTGWFCCMQQVGAVTPQQSSRKPLLQCGGAIQPLPRLSYITEPGRINRALLGCGCVWGVAS